MQISAGHSVDTNSTSSLEKNPRQDMTQELIPLSLVQRCLTPSALFPLAEQSGGGERDFLYLHTLGRDCLQRVVSAETVLTPSTSGKCRAGYDTKNQTFINMQAKLRVHKLHFSLE